MNKNVQGHSTSGDETEPDVPIYRARENDLLAFRAAKIVFGIVGGVLGLSGSILTFVLAINHRLEDALRTEIRNERVERINADQNIWNEVRARR